MHQPGQSASDLRCEQSVSAHQDPSKPASDPDGISQTRFKHTVGNVLWSSYMNLRAVPQLACGGPQSGQIGPCSA